MFMMITCLFWSLLFVSMVLIFLSLFIVFWLIICQCFVVFVYCLFLISLFTFKNPMDISAIEKKLDNSSYINRDEVGVIG